MGQRVAFRADAAFARPEIYEALEARGVGYAIGIPANRNLELEIEDILFRSPGRPSRKPLISYKSFHYQADSWTTARRVVAKVEHHVGELFPRVGFIVTNLPLPNRAVVRFDNKRGTAEQWIREGKQAAHWTRLSCHRFRANEVRLQLSVLAYDLGNLWRRLVLPAPIDTWSLTSLQQRLVKTGGRLVKHSRYYWLLLAESHLTRRLFGSMLRRIWAFRCQPADGRALPETVGEERTEGGRSVRKNARGVVPRVTIRAAGRVFRCETHAGRNRDRARSGWCRMRPINGRQIGNVGLIVHTVSFHPSEPRCGNNR